MKTEHEIEGLFRCLTDHFNTFDDYRGLEPLHSEPFSKSTAFFPGGYGLWDVKESRPLPSMPRNGIMVLGNDFGKRLGDRGELTGATWRGLTTKVENSQHPHDIYRGILDEAGVDLKKCFFTNAYMGIRSGKPQGGPSPALLKSKSAQDFLKKCLDFFEDQLKAQKPTLIVSLGRLVPAFIQSFRNRNSSFDLWSPAVTSGISLDRFNNASAIGEVRYEFETNRSQTAIWVVLTHPSRAQLNRRNRQYGSFDATSEDDVTKSRCVGRSAEVAMLREAMKRAGIKGSEDANDMVTL